MLKSWKSTMFKILQIAASQTKGMKDILIYSNLVYLTTVVFCL